MLNIWYAYSTGGTISLDNNVSRSVEFLLTIVIPFELLKERERERERQPLYG